MNPMTKFGEEGFEFFLHWVAAMVRSHRDGLTLF